MVAIAQVAATPAEAATNLATSVILKRSEGPVVCGTQATGPSALSHLEDVLQRRCVQAFFAYQLAREAIKHLAIRTQN